MLLEECYTIADKTVCLSCPDTLYTAVAQTFTGWAVKPLAARPVNHFCAAIDLEACRELPPIPADCQSFEVAFGAVCYVKNNQFWVRDRGSLVTFDDAEPIVVRGWIVPGEASENTLRMTVSLVFQAALRRCRRFDLHAAAVVNPESGRSALFVAGSNSGKSTLAVLLASRGWGHLSDDFVLLEEQPEWVRVWALRRGFGLRKNTLLNVAVPEVQRAIGTDIFGIPDKRQFEPGELFPTGYVEHHRADTLFFPSITNRDKTEIVKLNKAEAMRRLLRVCPWACYDRPVAAAYLKILQRLANTCPAYDLHSGRDLLDAQTAAALIGGYV